MNRMLASRCIVLLFAVACRADGGRIEQASQVDVASSAGVRTPDSAASFSGAGAAADQFPAYDSLGAEHRSLLGSSHPPIVPAYSQVSSGLVPGEPGTDWSVSLLSTGIHQVLTLDSLSHMVAGTPHWVTRSAIQLPILRDAAEQVVEVDCYLDGRQDVTIVAIGRWITGGPHLQDLDSIRFAVRPNVRLRRFDALPPGRVTCWVDEDRR